MDATPRPRAHAPGFWELYTPKLVTVLREGYRPAHLRADLIAGLTVASVALPLSMAIAIASGVTPDRGLYTAIVGGLFVSLLGGSRFQVGGPAGAFIVLVAQTVQNHGLDGVVLATMMAGVFLIAAGFLHDTIEDTATTTDELRDLFGDDILSLVLEVTDDKSLPKLERKRLQIEMTPKKSRRARLLKMADATSNVRTLEIDPPTDWGTDRMLDYIVWAQQVIASCRGLNAFLETTFDNAAVTARASVKARIAKGAHA